MRADSDPRRRGPEPGARRGISGLVRDIAQDLVQLIRGELALAGSELGDKSRQLGRGSAKVLAGGLLGVVGLLILAEALVIALANVMPAWLAAIVVAVLLAIVAVVMVLQGRRRLDPELVIPRRAARSLERDARLVKERL